MGRSVSALTPIGDDKLFHRFRRAAITPDVLKGPEFDDWLLLPGIANDLEALAVARLLSSDDSLPAERLLRSYAETTPSPADPRQALDLLVGVIHEQTFATLSTDAKAILAIELHRTQAAVNKADGASPEAIESDAKGIIVPALTATFQGQLDRILAMRHLADHDETSTAMRRLVAILNACGPKHVDEFLIIRTKYWCARLLAQDASTVAEARALRAQLKSLSPADSAILDALLVAQDGSIDDGLRMLRDHDSPDARSIAYILLQRRSVAEALDWLRCELTIRAAHLQLGSDGWIVALRDLLAEGAWDRANEIIDQLELERERLPQLLLIAATAKAGLAFIPDARPHLLQTAPIVGPQAPLSEGPRTNTLLLEAARLLQLAEALLTELGGRQRDAVRASRLSIQLRADDHGSRASASKELSELLQSPARAVSVLWLALQYSISFDHERVWTHLKSRAQLGGLTPQETDAELELAQARLSPQDYANYLQRDRARFAEALGAKTAAAALLAAFLQADATDDIHLLLAEDGALFDEHERKRIHAHLEGRAGGDPQSTLRELYQQTNSWADLSNLVEHLFQKRDWNSVLPYAAQLYERHQTTQNLARYISALLHARRWRSALDVLDANRHLVDAAPELQHFEAVARFRTGDLDTAGLQNRRLLATRGSVADLDLAMDIALRSGQWADLPALLVRFLEQPTGELRRPPLFLASLAVQAGDEHQRVLTLLEKAVACAPDDPEVLAGAVQLAFRIGEESETTSNWLSRAVHLSSEGGPVQRVGLQELVTEVMPAREEHLRNVQAQLNDGAIPLQMAAAAGGGSLASLLLRQALDNQHSVDARQRLFLPVFSGAREPAATESSMAAGFDVSAILVLGVIGILQEALTYFRQTYIAPSTMSVLLEERQRLRFHQPSLVKFAEWLREEFERGTIKEVTRPFDVEPALALEVGYHLADLLTLARQNGGVVVHPLPVHKAGSLGEAEASLTPRDVELLASPADLADSMVEWGAVDAPAVEGVRSRLGARRRDAVLARNTPLFIDQLGISTLRHARLVEPLLAFDLDIRAHPAVRQEILALIREQQACRRAEAALDRIRLALSAGLANGSVRYLPESALSDDLDRDVMKVLPTVSEFLLDSQPCELLVTDDRFINANSTLTDQSGRVTPVVSSVDVLAALPAAGHADHTIDLARQTLRVSGFGFTPLLAPELTRLLDQAQCSGEGDLIESPQLRAIRESLTLAERSQVLNPATEFAYITGLQLTAAKCIRDLWRDSATSLTDAAARATWIWEVVMPRPANWARSRLQADIREFERARLKIFTAPLIAESPEREKAYLEWADEVGIRPLIYANLTLIDSLAEEGLAQIKEWSQAK